jgi:hypothetical protein
MTKDEAPRKGRGGELELGGFAVQRPRAEKLEKL